MNSTRESDGEVPERAVSAEERREALRRLKEGIEANGCLCLWSRCPIHGESKGLLATAHDGLLAAEQEIAALRVALTRTKNRDWIDGPCWCTNAPPSDRDREHSYPCLLARRALSRDAGEAEGA